MTLLRHPLAQPFRQRDFSLLWAGMTVSLIGDGVFLVALAWQVYEISNVPTAMSVVGIAMSVPHVTLLLFAGVISDRMDRRVVMVAADVVRGAVIGVIAVLALTRALELWHLWPLMAVYGAATAFFGPAFDAIVPDVVDAEVLPQANALDQFIRPVGLRMLGPVLGGWMISSWGVGAVFLIDAASFAVSVSALLAVRARPRRAAPGASVVADLREGFRFVRRHLWLWGTFAAATLAYLLFMGPSEVLLPFLVKNDLGGTAGELGLVFGAGGLGAVAAALAMGHVGLPRRHITFIYCAWSLATLAVAGYGMARSLGQLMVVSFAFHALETAGTVAWLTVKQRHVPAHLLGRVSSFDWFISIGFLPVSYALTGPVAAVVGTRTTLVAAGLLGAAVTLSFLLLPGMRAPEREGSAPDHDGDHLAGTLIAASDR